MTDLRDLIHRMADELDHNRQCLLDDRRVTHPLADKARAARRPKPPSCVAKTNPVVEPTNHTMTNTSPRDLIQQLAGLARRKHYTCEDPWYSCPQSECGSANDNAGAECDCGADEHNAKVDAICAALSLPEPEGPTDEELLELMPQQMHEDLAAAARAMAEQAGTDSTRVKGVMRIILNRHIVDLAHAALARWGNHSAPQPIPVSERLPGVRDCAPWPGESDASAWGWVGSDVRWLLGGRPRRLHPLASRPRSAAAPVVHPTFLLMKELSPAAKTVLDRAMEFSGPAFERLVRQMLGEAIRSAVALTQQHHGNDVWECDADELLAIADELEAQ